MWLEIDPVLEDVLKGDTAVRLTVVGTPDGGVERDTFRLEMAADEEPWPEVGDYYLHDDTQYLVKYVQAEVEV